MIDATDVESIYQVPLVFNQGGLDGTSTGGGIFGKDSTVTLESSIVALNLAIGLNVSAPTGVVDTGDVPPFALSLSECLQAAVAARREFQVARESVRVAQEGSRVACADFAPRIVAEGSLLDYQQSAPRGHADLALGFIKLEWGLFEGGKRVAELRVADSRIREAVAGVRQAGSPSRAFPILAWLASHPNAPHDVLRDLAARGPREVLMNLCLNANLPADLRRELLAHPDDEVRRHARQILGRTRKH